LSAYFTPNGIHLTPHKTKSEVGPDEQASTRADWRAGMSLIGYGYGDHLSTVGGAELKANGARIEYRRAWPALTEWYINKAGGWEQGFTLAAAPGARAGGERLRLELELTGNLRAEPGEEGHAIVLKQEDGEPALRYSDLSASDAEGRALP